ncbi:hypothetical protein R6Q59_002295 [Mikania micrantha]
MATMESNSYFVNILRSSVRCRRWWSDNSHMIMKSVVYVCVCHYENNIAMNITESSGKSLVLESIVGRDFLPRGSGIVTRRPLVLQLHKTEGRKEEYAEFGHMPRRRFTDFYLVRKEIQDETDRITGKSKQISPIPIHLSLYSPIVVNLTLIDLPGLTKVAVEGQPESIVEDIEKMVRTYVEKPNSIIMAISPANQDIATSDAMKLAREVDPTGERTFGVLTRLDLMDKGTNALDVLEGRAYRLQHPWVGIVNRSQADVNKNTDIIYARRKELEYFATSPDYGHLANKMGSEYLAKLLSQAQLYTILELCSAFDKIFKEHLDGGRRGSDRIYGVFDHQLPAALRKLPFDKHLSLQNVRKLVSKADGYQPHLIAPEQVVRMVEMESSYLTVDFFHKLPKEGEKMGSTPSPGDRRNPPGLDCMNLSGPLADRYAEAHFRRIGSNWYQIRSGSQFQKQWFIVKLKKLSKIF